MGPALCAVLLAAAPGLDLLVRGGRVVDGTGNPSYLADVGINDKFMKELAAAMNPGSSALFVLVRKATPDKVLAELQGSGGKVLKTSLSHDDEAKLQAALSAAKT